MSDTAAVPTSPEPDRFEALDGLRGIAVLFVMLYHFGTAVGFSKFYMRRTLRIFPLYYLSRVVLFVVLPLLDLPALDNPGIERVRAAQGWMWAYAQDFAIAYYNEDFFDPDPL